MIPRGKLLFLVNMYSPKNESKFGIMTKNFFIKIMTEIGKNRPRSLKEKENYEFYALIRVADELEDGTKPI